jgi:hypothetical protein
MLRNPDSDTQGYTSYMLFQVQKINYYYRLSLLHVFKIISREVNISTSRTEKNRFVGGIKN